MSLTQHFSGVTPIRAVANNIHTPVSNSNTPVLCSPNDTHPDNTISKYLVPPPLSKPTNQTLPRARLLTSATALEILNEKERKKTRSGRIKGAKKKQREEMKESKRKNNKDGRQRSKLKRQNREQGRKLNEKKKRLKKKHKKHEARESSQ